MRTAVRFVITLPQRVVGGPVLAHVKSLIEFWKESSEEADYPQLNADFADEGSALVESGVHGMRLIIIQGRGSKMHLCGKVRRG
jgi:hypothetical protein